MFFKDIESWSKSKLRAYWIIFNILYFLVALIIPIIIVGCRYQIFHYAKVRLTGWGIILAITIAIVGVRTLNRTLNKLPESTLSEQRVKYSILGLKALFVPIFLLIIMHLFKSDFDLAYNTIWWCLFSYMFAVVFDYMFIHYLDRELVLRNKAKEQNEINKRVENLKK